MNKLVVALLMMFLLSLQVGCSQDESTGPEAQPEKRTPVQAVDVTPRILFKEPSPLHRLERVSEALAVWRQYSSQQPTLLLLSNYPLLMPVPEQSSEEISKAVFSASAEELSRLSDLGMPAPLFLPEMTVDIAMREGWFSKLAWALPIRDPEQQLSLSVISEQFAKHQFASESELASLNLQDNVVHGTLRDVPVMISALQYLPELSGPVIVHFDPGYFQAMYKNEIATPILQGVKDVLTALRDRKIPVLAVTFDNSNLVGRISLDVRFLQHVLAKMVESPETFDQGMPVNWQRKADILYLSSFFKKDQIRELALAMDADEPDAAWVKFTLYRSAVEHKQGGEALSFLAEAVKLDPVYAMEYLSLSDLAYEKGRPDEALRMFSLAAEAFPENVQIKLKMAQLAAAIGEKDRALSLVEQLQKLEWSRIYYPDMPKYLDGLAAFVNGEESFVVEPAVDPITPLAPSDDPRRQRILK